MALLRSCTFLHFFVSICLFWTLSIIKGSVHGQTTTTSSFLLQSPCDTECPVNKRCLQDNFTVIWGYGNGDDHQCKTYKDCYGPSSDYTEDNPGFFPARLKPVDIARGSTVYFMPKGVGGVPFSFQVYNVSRRNFLSCSKVGGIEVSNGMTKILKVPAQFLSSLGYKFFIATGNAFYSCNFGLRLHMNIKDATNCSGHSTLPPGSRLCSGKGRCVSDTFSAGMSCECCHGNSGYYCEEYDGCFTDPCQRGNCTDVLAGLGEDFQCSCPKGYTGQTCDRDIDDCVSQPCKNGALCQDGLNSYTCLCPPDFHGAHCGKYSNLCDSLIPCKNSGRCSRVGIAKQSYVCHCAPGFTGQNCTLNATTSSSSPTNVLSSLFQTSSYASHELSSNSVVGSTISGQFSSPSVIASVLQTSDGRMVLSSTAEKVMTTSVPVVMATNLGSSVVMSSVLPTPIMSTPMPSSFTSVMITVKIPYSSKQPTQISPSVTIPLPSSTVSPTTIPPLENQTCTDTPCGEHGVCSSSLNSVSGLRFHCDCQYPTVGPVCTTGKRIIKLD